MDMISIMHQGNPYGHLTVSNKPMSTDALARIVGATPEETGRLLTELEEVGIFSRTDEGVIYCRRMIRDNRNRIMRGLNGGKGGNPALLAKPKQGTLPLSEADELMNELQQVEKEKDLRYETVVALYREHCELLAPIAKGAPATIKTRKVNVSQLWEMLYETYHVTSDDEAIALIESVFSEASKSDFLRGASGKSGFVACFDWLVTPKNFAKVRSGNYTNPDAVSGSEEFDLFWSRYPEIKRSGKSEALKAWASVPAGALKEIITSLDAWSQTEDWKKDSGKYIPSPKNFLIDEKWKVKPHGHHSGLDKRYKRESTELILGFHE